MTGITVPAIPVWLIHRPTAGGLVVPWITPRTTDGRYLFGTIDRNRMRLALRLKRCGVCGRPLGHRSVLIMRLSDMARERTNEPALHPQCAAYTVAACPMVGGRRPHYRSSPPRLDATMSPAPDSQFRWGASAEPWFTVWLADYEVIIDRGDLAASYASTGALRIRPVTWRLPHG